MIVGLLSTNKKTQLLLDIGTEVSHRAGMKLIETQRDFRRAHT
jgi:hypothetical protein